MTLAQQRIRNLRTKVFDGKVPTLKALELAGMDWSDLNDMRKEAGLHPLPPLGNGGRAARPIRDGGRDFTLEQFANAVLDLIGKPLLTDDGDIKRTPEGRVRTLSATTVNAWISLVRMVVEAVGDPRRVMRTLRDSDAVIGFLQSRSHTPSSLSTRLHYLTGLQRYLPEYRRLLGDGALEAYRDKAAVNRQRARDVAVEKTEDPDHAVRAFADIVAAVPEIADRFGPHSMEHLAARLHTEIPGLRDDLKGVRVFETASDVPDDTDNYYIVSEGRVGIGKFKTSYMFPPYDVKLRADTARLVRESLAKHPRRFLVGKVTLSKLVKRGFNAVGLDDVNNVMDIRHSMLTHMLNGNASLANVKRVAARFKHDVKTALGYVRVTTKS